MRQRVSTLVAALAVLSSPAAAQTDPAKCSVRIGGTVPAPVTVDADALAALPPHTVVASDHGQKPARYQGVRLSDLLALAKVELGAKLRGKAIAQYVVVTAADQYRVVYALPELDPAFTEREVLLVTRKDGREISEPEGPCRIVAPGDKRHARWIRQVRSIELRQVDP
jgi:DMSO/TMAO reductase YedYZ molybdopterin-dependent catalytic subunit